VFLASWLRDTLPWLLLVAGFLCGPWAQAQTAGELVVNPAPAVTTEVGIPIAELRIETEGRLWRERPVLRTVRVGDSYSPELLRRGLRELEDTGRFGELSVEVAKAQAGLLVLFRARPRRLVASVRFEGHLGDADGLERELRLAIGDEITDVVLDQAQKRLTAEYERAGYPRAQVLLRADDTDDPMRKLVRVIVESGPPELIGKVDFRVWPSPSHPDLIASLRKFELTAGTQLASERVDQALLDFKTLLFERGFYEAEVTATRAGPGVLRVEVRSGPLFSLRLEGSETFGVADLEPVLGLAAGGEVVPALLEDKLTAHYVSHGFLDARVTFERRDRADGLRSELSAWIREGERFSVTERRFPCAGSTRSKKELESEVDGVLKERFPALSLVHPPDAEGLDAALGTSSASPRATPLPPRPYTSYSTEAYTEVRRHLEELYRSDGYLSATVGPVTLVRATCERRDGFGRCISGPADVPPPSCSEAQGEREALIETCVPDPVRGVSCAPTGVVVIPIVPGPLAILHDVALSGNRQFTEQRLLELARLPVGKPVRAPEIDAGLRRISDLYADEGFAFAGVDSDLELSPDGTRARLSIVVTERQRVRVSMIEVRGAERTREKLIRKRLALKPGDVYRRAAAVRSQEQVESLGMYTSVAVGLRDPGVPSREKVVVVTVTERRPQYIDIKGGFATADGFRIGFEYGHRNLGRSAIQLSIRSQLGLRPVFLIPEADVRAKYEKLQEEGLAKLLERRNTLGLTFPEIGLGPRVRLETELLDLYDNNRDYSQRKDAVVLQLTYRLRRDLYFQGGGTVEWNDATIFDDQMTSSGGTSTTLHIAEGESVAITQNVRATWDRRDRALAAHRGTFVGLGLEHVDAVPVQATEGECNKDSDNALAAGCSHLFRYTGRLGGYIPLSKKGLTLALSVRSGIIQHLVRDDPDDGVVTPDSKAYPDRLFYVGGVDTIRGYPQDSLVPQELADDVLAGRLAIEDVVLRGGDFFLTPRIELRIPLVGSLETAIFLDAGNVWVDPGKVNLRDLRYSFGTGLRVDTPVGPLVFDYGFNLDRVLTEFGVVLPNRPPRLWEDLGAFHFSIGLF
jgi:outer membrane protein insertion porin family